MSGKRGLQVVEQSRVFSPDGQRMAYAKGDPNSEADTFVVVVDGQEGKKHGGGQGPPVFSSDSRRVAYVAIGDYYNGKFWVVVDGRDWGPYDRILEGSLAFSPNSRRVTYVIAEGSGFLGLRKVHTVVIDGRGGKRYDRIMSPPGSGGVVFDSSDQLHYIARKAALMWSRLPVGSSPMRSRGSFARARAMDTRCCCPPESRSGVFSA